MSSTVEQLRTSDPLRFPIGPYVIPAVIDEATIDSWVNDIETFPQRLRAEIDILNDDQLQWRYRPEGWTVRQVVHHCADSHINAVTRFKLALTEENPEIRPYFENRWGELPDGNTAPVAWSLDILQPLHAKWAYLLKRLDGNDMKKSFFHPEYKRSFRIDETIGNYAWHCNHHLAHVVLAKELQHNV